MAKKKKETLLVQKMKLHLSLLSLQWVAAEKKLDIELIELQSEKSKDLPWEGISGIWHVFPKYSYHS